MSKSFTGLVSSPDNNGIADQGGAPTAFPNLIGEFRLAIKTPSGQVWSSLASDNTDITDHMVTWVDGIDPHHYFVAFEDLAFPGSDGDFNDIVLELRNIADGPEAAVPEPASLALLGLGLAGLGFARRRKVTGAVAGP